MSPLRGVDVLVADDIFASSGPTKFMGLRVVPIHSNRWPVNAAVVVSAPQADALKRAFEGRKSALPPGASCEPPPEFLAMQVVMNDSDLWLVDAVVLMSAGMAGALTLALESWK
jgi:hypothetical protein